MLRVRVGAGLCGGIKSALVSLDMGARSFSRKEGGECRRKLGRRQERDWGLISPAAFSLLTKAEGGVVC